jgi:hypothetical protein
MNASAPTAEYWRARREWWRTESRRVGSDWPGIIALRCAILATTYRAPAQLCPRLTQQADDAFRRRSTRPRPSDAPQVTLDALAWVARNNPAALDSPRNRHRMSTLSPAQRDGLRSHAMELKVSA